MQQPPEGRAPDPSFSQENVAVLVGPQATLTIVEVEERRGTPGSRLELIEDLA
jgi:hypothetical protein